MNLDCCVQCIFVRRRLASVFASIELSQKLHADTCKLIRIRRWTTRMREKKNNEEKKKKTHWFECVAVDRGNARRKMVVLNFEEMRDVSQSIYCRYTMVVWVLKRSLILLFTLLLKCRNFCGLNISSVCVFAFRLCYVLRISTNRQLFAWVQYAYRCNCLLYSLW